MTVRTTASDKQRHDWTLAMVLAVAGHAALFIWLSLARNDVPPPVFDTAPMAVELVAETAPVSTAPVPSTDAPAAMLGVVDDVIPPEQVTQPVPPEPVRQLTPPTPKPAPPAAAPVKPTPAPVPKLVTPRPTTTAPAARPTTTRPTATRPATTRPNPAPSGSLDGIVAGVARDNAGRSTNAPAAQSGAQVRQSIDVAIDGRIRPFWLRNVPSGADVDQLVTVIELRLNRDGSLAGAPHLIAQSGQTDSNRPQQALFVERAMKSLQQAAPFDLPVEYYDQWRVWRVTFRARGRL